MTNYVHPSTPLQDRFDFKWVPVTESGCWLWTGKTSKHTRGIRTDVRPRISFNKKSVFAHRLSWELHRGPIPAGLLVCHKCDTPLCVNPDHLFLGTIADNNHDRHLKGRTGFLVGVNSTNHKLTEAQVLEIRERCASGERYSDLSPEYQVTPESIGNVAKRRFWRHVA